MAGGGVERIGGSLPRHDCETLANPSKTRPVRLLLGSTRVENLSRSCRAARWIWDRFDAIAETSQFTDHLARAHLLRLFTDGGAAFFIADALVEQLPNQTAQAMGDGADRLGVAEARDQATVHDVEDRPFRLHRGVGGLVEDASHLPIAFGVGGPDLSQMEPTDELV